MIAWGIEHRDMEAPNHKHQTPNESQSPKFEAPYPIPLHLGERGRVRGAFEIGIWSLFGIWNL